MSGVDLTRWNRAGLSRLRYVNGNAATYLEDLRGELAERFGRWKEVHPDVPSDETVDERIARVLAQYRAERRDWAWETTRAFARALHVLTEHIDAFANEGYLRTATQLQSVRRLAAMVGYTPTPASSAATPVVLLAETGVTSATVPRGFAMKHVPAGAPPIIFETLQDLEIAAALNALRLGNFNRNIEPLSAADVLWPVPAGVKVSVGGLAILAKTGGEAGVVKIAALTDGPALIVSDAQGVPGGLTFGTAELHVSPAQILVPRLNGAGVVRLSSPHDLVAGEVVAWKVGGTTRFASVLAVDGGSGRLQPGVGVALPAKGTMLFRAAPITFAQFTANASEWRLPTNVPRSGDFGITFMGPDGRVNAGLAETDLVVEHNHNKAGYDRLGGPVLGGVRQIWFADPGKDRPVASIQPNLPAKPLEFDGTPPGLAPGDLVILQTAGEFSSNRIDHIENDAGSFRIALKTDLAAASVTAVHAGFAAILRPRGRDINPTPVTAVDLDLDVDAGTWPDLLVHGRRVVLESASGAFAPFAARIASVDAGRRSIRLDTAATALATIRRGDLVIRANVVETGHGETKPVRVLGSGDATASSQRFAIDVNDVSHVREPAMPGGVRADIRVEVEHEIYRQVASLRDSKPADPHYVVRIADDGTIELQFGDGRRGRRLPSGNNNVLATLRRGCGLSGNLAEGSLTEVVRKHPAVDNFLQPIAASGGDDREGLEQLRERVPGRLAAMDRAISVADYQRLAQRFQGVWHARAFENPDHRRNRETVRVVIVPSGGGPLGALAEDIRGFLTSNGLPSVDIIVEPFVPLPLEILARVGVDSTRFDPREVARRARAAMLTAFNLQRRQPGQPLYRSEVIRLLEGTNGVSHSDVVLFASAPPNQEPKWDHVGRGKGDAIWAVFPRENQVVFAATPRLITVTLEEATN
jgi:hypothetical protein